MATMEGIGVKAGVGDKRLLSDIDSVVAKELLLGASRVLLWARMMI